MSAEIHRYDFTPIEIQQEFPDEILQQVIASAAFKRLKSIKFLGAIDYILPAGARRPKKRHSRYQHSLAVARLASIYCKLRDFSLTDYRYCVIAALLHDIGHAPLSHSLESVFKSQFEIDHHVSGERIIRGEVEIGRGLSSVLANANINNFRIMSIIAGVDEPRFNEIFSHAINIDTIEAILRSLTYIYKIDSQLTAAKVLHALVERGPGAQDVLDAFWRAKEEVYAKLIQGRMGLVADFICKRYMELNSKEFKASYYYGTEQELRRDHSRLFDVLEVFGRTQHIPEDLIPNGYEISCTVRRFVIDMSVRIVDNASIDKRYTQTKRKAKFVVTKRRFENEGNLEQWHKDSDYLFK